MDTQAALQTLELSRPFTKAELKKAYRDALLVWHPDRFPDGSELKAKAEARTYKITEAYAMLSKMPEDSAPSNAAYTHKPPTAHNPEPKTRPTNIHRKPPSAPPIRKQSPVDHSRQSGQRPPAWHPWIFGFFKNLEGVLNSPKALRIYSMTAWITVAPFVLLVIISIAADSIGDKDKSHQVSLKPTQSPSAPAISTFGLTDEQKKKVFEDFRISIPSPPPTIKPLKLPSLDYVPPAMPRIEKVKPAQPVSPPQNLTHLASDSRLYSGVIKDSLATLGGRGKLVLENGLEADAHVKLIVADQLAASFYVRGNSQFTFDHIPDGFYTLLYCTGYGWDIGKGDFTRGRTATKYDRTLSYQTRTTIEGNQRITSTDILTLTLHKVAHGNTSTSEVSLDEFDRY